MRLIKNVIRLQKLGETKTVAPSHTIGEMKIQTSINMGRSKHSRFPRIPRQPQPSQVLTFSVVSNSLRTFASFLQPLKPIRSNPLSSGICWPRKSIILPAPNLNNLTRVKLKNRRRKMDIRIDRNAERHKKMLGQKKNTPQGQYCQLK